MRLQSVFDTPGHTLRLSSV